MTRIDNDLKITPIIPTHQPKRYDREQKTQGQMEMERRFKEHSKSCQCDWCCEIFRCSELTDLEYGVDEYPHSQAKKTAQLCTSCRDKVHSIFMANKKNEFINRLEIPCYKRESV